MAKSQEETPRFSFAFMGKIAPAGRKVQGSSRPEVIATSTKDKFVINQKAKSLMGLSEGSKIVMIDQNLDLPAGSRLPQNERFFLAIAPEGYEAAAKLGDTNAFSYSGVWSAVIMNDPELTEASTADLVRAEKAILRGDKGKNFVGLQTVRMEVVPYTEEDEDGKVISNFVIAENYPAVPLYRLQNAEVKPHDPKSVKSDEAEAEGEEA